MGIESGYHHIGRSIQYAKVVLTHVGFGPRKKINARAIRFYDYIYKVPDIMWKFRCGGEAKVQESGLLVVVAAGGSGAAAARHGSRRTTTTIRRLSDAWCRKVGGCLLVRRARTQMCSFSVRRRKKKTIPKKKQKKQNKQRDRYAYACNVCTSYYTS